MWYHTIINLVVSIVLGGAVGLTLQQIGYDEEIVFNPNVVAGKRVLITGASTGIGQHLAYLYCQHGAKVFITARREEVLKEVADKCKQKGAPLVGYVEADLMRVIDAAKVVHMAQKHLSGLDYVVLGHAYSPVLRHWRGTGKEITDTQVIFDINVKSYIHIATHALPYLTASNGSIGIMNSVAGKLYVPYMSLYTMSKHALDGYFSTLRAELRQSGVNVSVTSCFLGGIDTERKRKQLDRAQDDFSIDLTSLFNQLAPVQGAAYSIMRGISTRQTSIYYPPDQNIKARILLAELFPSYSEIHFAGPKHLSS